MFRRSAAAHGRTRLHRSGGETIDARIRTVHGCDLSSGRCTWRADARRPTRTRQRRFLRRRARRSVATPSSRRLSRSWPPAGPAKSAETTSCRLSSRSRASFPDKYVRKDEIPAQESDPTSSGFNGDQLRRFRRRHRRGRAGPHPARVAGRTACGGADAPPVVRRLAREPRPSACPAARRRQAPPRRAGR